MNSRKYLTLKWFVVFFLVVCPQDRIYACNDDPEKPTISVEGAEEADVDNYYIVQIPDEDTKTVTLTADGETPCLTDEEKCKCGDDEQDPETDEGLIYTFTKPEGEQKPANGPTINWNISSSTSPREYKFKVTNIEQKYKDCPENFTGGVSSKSNKEESKETVILVVKVSVEDASIEDGKFKVSVGTGSETGSLKLKLKNNNSEEALLFEKEDVGSGELEVELDECVTNLSGKDGKQFDKVVAEFEIKGVTITSKEVSLDHKVEVLNNYKVTNYFSPDWNAAWNGADWNPIGMYASGKYPGGLSNVTKKVELLNMMDHATQGLSVEINQSSISSVIRFQYRPAVTNYTRWNMNNGGGGAYIENPDRSQSTAGCPSVQHLRSTSSAVRTDNSKLKCGDRVYVPEFGIRDIDDHGSLSGAGTLQIDIYRGEGGSSLKTTVFSYTKTGRVLLKIIP